MWPRAARAHGGMRMSGNEAWYPALLQLWRALYVALPIKHPQLPDPGGVPLSFLPLVSVPSRFSLVPSVLHPQPSSRPPSPVPAARAESSLCSPREQLAEHQKFSWGSVKALFWGWPSPRLAAATAALVHYLCTGWIYRSAT